MPGLGNGSNELTKKSVCFCLMRWGYRRDSYNATIMPVWQHPSCYMQIPAKSTVAKSNSHHSELQNECSENFQLCAKRRSTLKLWITFCSVAGLWGFSSIPSGTLALEKLVTPLLSGCLVIKSN